MTGFKDRLLNILLFPARYHLSLTDKKPVLLAGILLIGIIDLFSPDVIGMYKLLFTRIPAESVRMNILMAFAVVVLLGAVDVVFFSVPLYDFFKYLKKKEDKPHGASPVKVMKVYISSHFLIVPVSIFMYYAVFSGVTPNSSPFLVNFYIAFFFLILVWSSGIVSRGINALFDFNPFFRRLSFIVIFTWNFVLGTVFQFQIVNLLMKLFIQV